MSSYIRKFTYFIFITHQKYYILHLHHISKILHCKILHLTSKSKNLTSHTGIISHIISSSHIKNLTPEKYYISYRKNIISHIYIKKYYILHQKYITSYIFITSKLYILHRKILHLTSSSHIKNPPSEKYYISHQKNLTSCIYIKNLTSCIYIIKYCILQII